ncbi:MAG TPA: hypothetical protein VN089_25740, partial [Duganella sp.]|nr:hypothetical protein [Duganella sp.]
PVGASAPGPGESARRPRFPAYPDFPNTPFRDQFAILRGIKTAPGMTNQPGDICRRKKNTASRAVF